MKTNQYFSTVAVATVLLVCASAPLGCAGSRSATRSGLEREALPEGGTLAIAPVQGEWHIRKADAIAQDLNLEPEQPHEPVLLSMLSDALYEVTMLDTVAWTTFEQEPSWKPFKFESTTERNMVEWVEMDVPADSGCAFLGRARPDYVLFMKDARVSRVKRLGPVQVAASAQYLFWDCATGAPVWFGQASDDVAEPAADSALWYSRLMENIAEEMVEKSPFQPRSGNVRKRHFVDPAYEGQHFTEGTLVIAPLASPPQIGNAEDVTDYLGPGDPRQAYADFLVPTLQKALEAATAVSSVEVLAYADAPRLEARSLELHKGRRMRVPLPEDGQRVRFEKGEADFVLFLDDVHTGRENQMSGPRMVFSGSGGPPMMVGGGASRSLVQALNYALWDNRAGKLICYGQKSAEKGFNFGISERTWRRGVEKIADEIVHHTPLEPQRD